MPKNRQKKTDNFDSLYINREKVSFTQREKEILKLMIKGLPNKEIARALSKEKNEISFRTIEAHKNNIYKKTLCKNQEELINIFKSCRKKQILKIICFLSFSVFLVLIFLAFIIKNKEEANSNIFSLINDFAVPSEHVFLERKELEKKLENTLNSGKDISFVVLVATGGSGKTILARNYALQNSANIKWELNGESKSSFLQSIEDLSHVLAENEEENIKLKQIKECSGLIYRKKLIHFVKSLLRHKKEWILIYDNVKNFDVVKDFFPFDKNSWGSGKIIITSRNVNFFNNSYIPSRKIILIPELSKSEKLYLFEKILVSQGKMESIKTMNINEFIEKVPPFPLDIVLSAFNFTNSDITYDEYINSLGDGQIANDPKKFLNARFKIVNSSFRSLLDPNSVFKDILAYLLVLNPSYISIDFLEHIFGKKIIKKFVLTLKENAFIIEKSKIKTDVSKSISIHESLISVLKASKESLTTPLSTENIIENIILYTEKELEKESSNKISLLKKNLSYISENISGLSEKCLVSLKKTLADILYFEGKYSMSKESYENIYEKNYEYLQADKEMAAKVYISLGKANNRLGYGVESVKFYEKFMKIARDLGYEDKISETYMLIGDSLKNSGKYKESYDYFYKALLTYKRKNLLDKYHWTLSKIGNLCIFLGDHDKAIENLEKSYKYLKDKYGEDDLKISWIQSVLAYAYIDVGFYNEAKSLLDSAIKIRIKYLGEESTKTAFVYANLGRLEAQKGNTKKADEYFSKSLKVFSKSLGDNHPVISPFVLGNKSRHMFFL